MKKTLSFLFVLFVLVQATAAQELQARFSVVANQVSTQVDKKSLPNPANSPDQFREQPQME